MNSARNHLVYSAAVLGVIALGLASREAHLRAIFGTSPGDALWATMVYLGLGMLMPRISSDRLAVVSLIAAYGIEFSQLIQTPWLLAIRGTIPGHLVLGSTFYWPDLIGCFGRSVRFFDRWSQGHAFQQPAEFLFRQNRYGPLAFRVAVGGLELHFIAVQPENADGFFAFLINFVLVDPHGGRWVAG